MFDAEAASSKRFLEELARPRVRANLLKLAAWRTGNPTDAEDLLVAAIEAVCDPQKQPWNPAHSFYTHMTIVMRDVWFAEMRSARVRREVIDTEVAHDEATADPQPQPDEALQAHRDLAWLRALADRTLVALGDDDPVATGVLLAAPLGTDDPDELAAMLSHSAEDVRNAIRRLKYHGAKVRKEMEQEEAARMAEAREKAERDRARRATKKEDPS